MTTAVVSVGPARMSNLRHAALVTFWFGLNFHWIPIPAILVPYEIIHLLPRDQQGSGIAVVTGAGAVFAVLLPPLVGAYSPLARS